MAIVHMRCASEFNRAIYIDFSDEAECRRNWIAILWISTALTSLVVAVVDIGQTSEDSVLGLCSFFRTHTLQHKTSANAYREYKDPGAHSSRFALSDC
jgi:hypothetical protein